METVEYKYAPKTKVFFIKMVTKETFGKCPICDGEGKLLKLNGGVITCPQCYGAKQIKTGGTLEYVVDSAKVSAIDITLEKNYLSVTYWLKGVDGGYDESSLFPTEEEAMESKPKGISGYASSQGTVGTPL